MSDLLIEQFCVMLSDHLENAVGIPISKAESAKYLQAVIQADASLRAVFENRMVQFNQGNSTGFQTWLESGAKGFFGTNYIVSDPAVLREGLRSLLDELAKQPVGTPSNLPLSGVVKFVGRDEALETVHEKLQQTATVAITSVSGIGGVGKTELALQYAYRKLRETTYPGGICWVQARSQDVGIGILEFARNQLGLPQPPEQLQTVPQQVKWVCGRWQGEPILIVLDDVTDYANVKPYLAQLDPRFRVLMTTRLKLDTSAQRLELEVLTEEAALELLRVLVADAERIDSQLEDAERLCEWLGRLPLGLELVGRYLARKPDLRLGPMLERLEAKKLKARALLYTEDKIQTMTAKLGVAAAFQLTWEEDDFPNEARWLCGLLSVFALAPIPWQLVQWCLPDWDEEDLEDCRDTQLIGRSLLSRVAQERYQLHQLVREFFVVKLETELSDGAETLRQRFAEVLTAVAKTIPQTVTLEVISRVEDALPHLGVVAEQLTHLLEGEDKTWSMTGLARVAEAQSFWQDAERWLKRALQINETHLGKDHPHTASSLNNLAGLYRSMGRYSEAEPLYGRALQINETHLGKDHPDTATSLNNLANLYSSMGRYSDAEPLYGRALQINETQLDKDHPDTATSLNNLANLYFSMGRYSEAEPLYGRSLQISETHLGKDHPDTAISMGNLASLYTALKRYADAETYLLQALQIFLQSVGQEHPYTTETVNRFVNLIQQAVESDRAGELSAHPFTQAILQQVQQQS